jgi:hypothetical protein
MPTFDPRFHPRSRRGAFVKALERLAPGETLTTPDGQKATRTKRGTFNVEGVDIPREAHDAADRMMTASAKSSHPKSLGDGKTFTSYSHFAAREQKVERQRENVQKSRRGMREKPSK